MMMRRHDNPNDNIPEPGDYGKSLDGNWFACPPYPLDDDGFPLVANLANHKVEEHEDSTISVQPSILITGRGRRLSHGFLERGIWRDT